ncbi:MAG: hypothetical protein WD096_09095 [Actinomycetota bacterium]
MTIRPDTEVYGIAVTIFPFSDTYGRTMSSFLDPEFSQVISVTPSTAGGQSASQIEVSATGNGFDAKGTMTYAYVVDLNGKGLVLLTNGFPGATYDVDRAVVDLMAGSLTFTK